MPDPIICIHTGTTTWQGPQSEMPSHLRHKLAPPATYSQKELVQQSPRATPAMRQIEIFSRRATEFYQMIGAIGQEGE